MNNKQRNKQLSSIMDKHYMNANYFKKDKCVYCGSPSNDIDYVPPVEQAYAFGKNFMETNDQKINYEKLKEIQISFEESMKILERHVAESIANKNELGIIKNDLLEANKRFNQALNHLDELKNSIDFQNKTHTK